MNLRKWQKEALPIWKKQHRGIVKVITGAGKTYFAIKCIQDVLNSPKGPEKILILVPTVNLLDQWTLDVQDQLKTKVDKLGGGFNTKFTNNICIATYSSFKKIINIIERKKTFLVCDECHKAGTEKIGNNLKKGWGATLGLSATPERDFDENFEEIITPILGPIIYEYDYSKAYRDGIISRFEILNVYAPLLEDEEKEYLKFSKKIARRIASLGGIDKTDQILKLLFLERRRLINNSYNRIPAAIKTLKKLKYSKCIIFSETIEQASKFKKLLDFYKFNSAEYHSKIPPISRQRNLFLLKNDLISILVTCKSLDEGFDYPDLDSALILSSSSTSRQRIQRLGRVLRTTKTKEKALIISIYSSTDEFERLKKEENHFKKIGISLKWSRLNS